MRYILEDSVPDIMIFESEEDLLGYVEWYDVREGEFRVWDSVGFRHELVPDDGSHRDVTMESTGINEAGQAALAIMRHLQCVRPDIADLSHASNLPELIDRVPRR